MKKESEHERIWDLSADLIRENCDYGNKGNKTKAIELMNLIEDFIKKNKNISK